MQKKNLLTSLAILLAVPSAAVTATVLVGNNIQFINAEHNTYTVTIDASNCGSFVGTSYADGATTASNSPVTESGNPVYLTYSQIMKSNSSGFMQMKKNAGYLISTYGISGLTGFTAVFESGGGMPSVSFGGSAASFGAKTTLTSGVKVNASGDFFKFEAGSNALYVTSITLEYTCISSGGGSSSSSSSSSASGTSASSSQEEGWDNFYKATSVNANYKFGDFDYTVPTTGNVKLFVIPVELSDYPFSASELQEIETLFGGSAADTNYWESLASYYYKSSFGQLNMTFEFADVYRPNMTAQQYYNANLDSDWGFLGAPHAMEAAVADYKTKHGNASTQQFDSDNDGLIDACMMIYSCPNDYDSTIAAFDLDSAYWAYRWADPEFVDYYVGPSSPVGCNFFWASLDFFYSGTGTRASHTGIDAHTLIHETGHLLGSDDYYNTFTFIQSGGEYHETLEPSGGVTMMAYNIQDHDIFTKLSYGWVKPYVVTGNAEITIDPSNVAGDCILLTDSWNGHAWDEYIIIELFTPDGLNQLDAVTAYEGTPGFSTYGIRMYHVDARLCKATDYNSSYTHVMSTAYATDTQIMNGTLDLYNDWYTVAARNSAEGDASFIQGRGYELVSLMSAQNQTFTQSTLASNGDLFQAGDSINLATSGHLNGGKLNNGASLNYTIQIESATSSSATLKFIQA